METMQTVISSTNCLITIEFFSKSFKEKLQRGICWSKFRINLHTLCSKMVQQPEFILCIALQQTKMQLFVKMSAFGI